MFVVGFRGDRKYQDSLTEFLIPATKPFEHLLVTTPQGYGSNQLERSSLSRIQMMVGKEDF